MQEHKKLILKYALQNAVNYKGKADLGAVIKGVFAELPDMRSKDGADAVKEIVEQVNSMNAEEQEKKLHEFGLQKIVKKESKEKERSIPELPLVKGAKVIMRFAPNPNGAMSLGHSRVALWNWFFAEKYKGKYILRFDDTDAKVKVPLKEAYKWFVADLKWLGIKIWKVVKQSSRLKIYYKYAEELLSKDCAYICTCNVEKWRELTRKRIACPCRNLGAKEQSTRWKKMFGGKNCYKEGEAVYRIKTELNNPDISIRDWPCFRIIEKPKHPLKTARVWPLLNFASAIDDYEFKTTHILRGIDLKVCDDKQRFLYQNLGWEYPKTLYNGKILVKGIKSTSQAKQMIEKGELSGWDDPRLGTIMAFRRKGFTSEAIINFIKDVGFGRADVNISFEKLVAFNKKIVDKKANRHFFVENPKLITIENTPKKIVRINKHPDFLKRGTRVFKTGNKFYIADEIKDGQAYRLIGLFNFKNMGFISTEHDPKLNAILIHWLPADAKNKEVDIIMTDNSIKSGLAEQSIAKLKIGDITQFQRFGFCRLDSRKGKKYIFYYTHN